MKRPTLKEFKKKALADKKTREAYEGLEEEFALTSALIGARNKAHMTQEEVAEEMHTQKSNVSRMENPNTISSPSINTLRRYAEAVGCKLQIKLVENG